ncbi:hypothetical protein FRC03_007811 [Tulasnella sp. 419]|nr:hypothetical protein FRC03_007811 [Tulasnella sp. 419]
MSNDTIDPSAHHGASGPMGLLMRWATLLLPILNSTYIQESLRLLILGSVIETGRRVCQWLLDRFTSGFFVTAHFAQGDYAYDWLNEFLAAQDIWTNSREFRVTATNTDARYIFTPGGSASTERTIAPKQSNDGNPHPIYFPSSEMPQVMRWRGHWIQVNRKFVPMTPFQDGDISGGELTLTVYTRRKRVLDDLVEEARQFYIKSSKPPATARNRAMNLSLTATFRQGDWVYEWILEYLSQQGAWNNATDVNVTAKTAEKKWGMNLGGNDREERLQAYYHPSGSAPHLWNYNGTWIQVLRLAGSRDYRTGREEGGQLMLTIYTTRKAVLDELVAAAAAQYWETSKRRVTVHMAEGYGDWGMVMTKQIRPMDSVILPGGLIETIVNDLREFMDTKDWYSAAGIPWRRGVLLWGPPGTGKSTTVHAIAGELQLEVYFISLSNASLDDNSLQRLVAGTPPNSILLLEDIDCAFPSREPDESQLDRPFDPYGQSLNRSNVTLSGILNILDSVSSEEGRIVFATTNHVDRLDPALLRPGRMDLRIEYKLASKDQTTGIFKRFYSHELMSKAMSQSGLGNKEKTSKTVLSSEASKLIQASDESFMSQLPSPERIAELAEAFGSKIPEGKYSVAQLQGFLLSKKKNPAGAVEEIEAWMQERDKEKEEKEKRIRARKKEIDVWERQERRRMAREKAEEEEERRRNEEEIAAADSDAEEGEDKDDDSNVVEVDGEAAERGSSKSGDNNSEDGKQG